ncbi:SRR1-like protein [Synchiropus splendidus]|uniref:SRR1-like protein n=1 Tax=Synchiropus splendidus TaxID=270530 RepID=UPI00237DD8B7|nr:SRR1-like protein [Synchiropus splendidus]
MSDSGEEWQVIRRRKGSARKPKNRQVSGGTICCQEELDVVKTVRRIQDTVAELRCEDFWIDWKEKLLEVAQSLPTSVITNENAQGTESSLPAQLQCVCYGLGPFSSIVSARYQLAMMLLLLEAAQIPMENCFVFDPVFSAGEKSVLKELGLMVLTENEEGKRLATKPSIFYLMHCGKALYNNLLWKNWSTDLLPRIIIIGNSFTGMKDRSVEREFTRDYSFLSQAATMAKERSLTCPSRMIDVFGDTAIMSFSSRSLLKLPELTWKDLAEPQYENCEDLEIILREAQC